MKFFKDTKLTVDVYTSEIKMIENYIASILGRLNKLEEPSIKPEPKPDVIRFVIAHNENGDEKIKLIFDGETGDLKGAEVKK